MTSILKEGGNIFKDPQTKEPLTQRINKADVLPTLQWLEQITGLPHGDFMLGSTGRKETSGDLDIAVNEKDVTKEELVQKLAAWCTANGKDPKAWIRKSGISVHFLTPINGNEANGFVQTDLMFGDPEWMKFALAGSDDKTKYKGRDKLILLSSIAKAQGMKYSARDGVMSRETDEPVEGGKIPAQIAKILLGPTAQQDDLESVETVITAIKDRQDYQALIADAKETLERDGIQLPESLAERQLNRIKELSGLGLNSVAMSSGSFIR